MSPGIPPGNFEDAAIQPESMRLHVPPEVHPGHVARYALADWGSRTLIAQPPLFLAKGEPPLKAAAVIDKSSAYPAGGVG